jgi:hypothetical protein
MCPMTAIAKAQTTTKNVPIIATSIGIPIAPRSAKAFS